MANPALIIRVAATLEEVKKNLGDIKAESRATAEAVTQLGGAPTVGMQRLGAATEGVVIPADRLRGSLRQMDAVLGQLGFNISGETNALVEMAEASGKTASELGLITTAGLAFGAAMAGWKIGKQIDEWTGLSTKIAEGTASLLGWGEVAEQTMGARWDTITAAIKRGAAVTISYSEAIAFNTNWQRKHQEELKASTAAAKSVSDAMVELNSVGIGWQGTLDTINGRVVEAIKFYLQAGVSQSQLAAAYGLTAVQVKSVASSLEAETVALTRLNDEQERWDALLKAIDSSISDKTKGLDLLYDKTVRQTEASLAEYNAQVKINESFGLDAQGRQKVTSAAETLRLGLEALHATKVEGIAQTNQEKVLMDAYTQTLYVDAVAQDRANVSLSQVPAIANSASQAINGVTSSYWAQVDAALAAHNAALIAAGLPPIPDIGRRAPSLEDPGFTSPRITGGGLHPLEGLHPLRDAGGPVAARESYLIGLNRRPEIFTPGASGFVTPMGAGGGTTLNLHLTINGSVLSDEYKIAKAVGPAVITLLRGQGLRLPSGA